MIVTFSPEQPPSLAQILECVASGTMKTVTGEPPDRVVASASQIEAWMRERGGADARAADRGERWAALMGAPLVLGHPVSVVWEDR